MPIYIALIEDDRRLCEQLQAYFQQQPELKCLMAVDSVETFLEELDVSMPPQVLLLDIGLPGISGLQALPMLTKRLPETDILMHTVFDDSDRLYEALRMGAAGYLVKSSSLAAYKDAILEVVNGGAPISRAIARKVLAYFKPTPSLAPNLLSEREREILEKLVAGMGEKQIVDATGLAPTTIHTHIKKIYRKLQVSSRGELLSRAVRGEL
jgi:DNA-binding NarL/FixJ family response regulator